MGKHRSHRPQTFNMKVSYLSIGLLALFSPLTAAWSKEDREIFRIRDEIAAHETDSSATFYDILGIKPAASIDDITKAYRTKRVVAENGKILVVDSLGDVYLEEEDKEGNVHEFLLDINELPKPTFFDTAVVRMPIWMVRSTVGRILGRSQPAADITEGITSMPKTLTKPSARRA